MSTKSHDKTETEVKDKQEKAEPSVLDQASREELIAKLNEAEQKNIQYWDRILRMQADAENIARRSERELSNAHKYALEKFLPELLPIIDNLERALSASTETRAEALAVIEGVALTLRMFYDALEKAGVKQINPENEAFNPSFHEAISMHVDASLKPGTVVSVLQKGYLLNDRLIRPALVVVSK